MRAAALALVVSAGCAAPPPPATPTATAPPPPSITRALHLAGDLPAAPTSIGAPGSIVEALYDVCLDERARVASVKPAPGLAVVDDMIAAALRRWSWFVVASGARPCWRERVLLAVPAVSRIVRQASTGVSALATRRPAAAPAPSVSTLYAGKIADGIYKVCAGDDGTVQSVRVVASIVGADDYAMASLRATAWDIVVGPLAQAPYCFAAPVHLDFTAAARGSGATALPPGTRAKEPGVSIVVRATR